jgi:ABC-type nitrate/sulfonate/bicarbonate transport system substrate-binding protein
MERPHGSGSGFRRPVSGGALGATWLRRKGWRHRSLVVCSFGAAVGMLLAACGSSGSSSSTPAASASASVVETTVTLQVPSPALQFTPFYVCKQLGICASYGIDLEIQPISPTLALDELASNELDAMASIGSAAGDAIKGQPYRVIEVSMDQTTQVMYAPTSITSVKQLVGKTIAGTSAVSPTNLVEEKILQHYGVNPKSVSFINVPGGATPEMALVKSGKAAASMGEPQNIATLGSGFHEIASASFFLEPESGIAVTETYLKSHRATLKKLVDAMIESAHVARTQEKKTERVLKSFLQVSSKEAASLWKFQRGVYTIGGRATPASLKSFDTAEKTLLSLSSAPTPSQYYTAQLLPSPKSALGKL